ncbi:MAG: hypothetical protein KGR46_12025 [Verrucomicrobia bacterium]|nr:hypothetical protein [Verrucomicrobiota bacterium]
MTALRDYLLAHGLDETAALNLLQDHGIISDLCVTAEEVGDSGRAVTWLHDRLDSLPKKLAATA